MAALRRIPLLLFALLAAGHALAVEVRETFWGFDGHVVPGRMNIVSLRLANTDDAPLEAVATLQQNIRGSGANGVPVVQTIHLGAHSERWVQFVVFVGGGEDFALSWGRTPLDEYRLTPPATGPPARVLLSEAARPLSVSGRLPILPGLLFPNTVAATDALDGIALDYIPQWTDAQSHALLDWVRRGGTVIVLHGADGQFPQFTGPLAALNIASYRTRIGAGAVLRVSSMRAEIGEAIFTRHGFPTPTLQTSTQPIVGDFEQALLQRLAQLTRPAVRWWLINSLTLFYLLLIGPAHFYFSRRFDYRISIGSFVGCVAAFSLAFAFVGRRGYGEAQSVYSLSIARALEPGRYDVTQWISAFATRSGVYALSHRAASNLYAMPSGEAVSGRVANDGNGQLVTDIPLYSSRQFIHRAAMQGEDSSVIVETWDGGPEMLNALALRTGPAFPREPVEIRARYRDRFYLLRQSGDRLTLADPEQAQRFEAFLSPTAIQRSIFNLRPSASSADGATNPDTELRAALPLLYLHALDGRSYFNHFIDRGPQPPDELELYIFAKMPETFRVQGEGFLREVGYVLYVQQVAKP
jgi:hypothetical protein